MSRKAMASGVGESKTFTDEKAFARNPLLDCHFAGKLVADLPAEVQVLITYEHTDEGVAEKQARLEAQGGPPRVEITRSEFEGQRQRLADTGINPMAEAVQPFEKRHPERSFKFLSKTVSARMGNRGWEPVRDKDGKEITVGTQVLASMPRQERDRRKAEAMAIDRFRTGQPIYDLIESVSEGGTDVRSAEQHLGLLDQQPKGRSTRQAYSDELLVGRGVERDDPES